MIVFCCFCWWFVFSLFLFFFLHPGSWMALEAEQLCNTFIPSMLARAPVTKADGGMAGCCCPAWSWLNYPSPLPL